MSEKAIEEEFNRVDKIVNWFYTSDYQDQIETECDMHWLYVGLGLPLRLLFYLFLLSVVIHVTDWGSLGIELVPISTEALAVSFVAVGSISATGVSSSSFDSPDGYKIRRDMQRLVGFWFIAVGFLIQLFVISVGTPFSETFIIEFISMLFTGSNIPLIEKIPLSLLGSGLLIIVFWLLTRYIELRADVWDEKTPATEEAEDTEGSEETEESKKTEDLEGTTDNQRRITLTIEYQKGESD